MAAVSVSANLDERDAKRVRMLAEREHRTVSSFISNAVVVFSDLPKDLEGFLAWNSEWTRMRRRFAPSSEKCPSWSRGGSSRWRRSAWPSRRSSPNCRKMPTDLDILDQASTISRGS